MKLFKLKCPNCGATLQESDGIGSYYCSHCGSSFVAEDVSDETVRAKVRLKELEEEKYESDRQLEQERYFYDEQGKRDQNQMKVKIRLILFALIIVLIIFIGLFIHHNTVV